ncbi:MAG: hypothetical protein AAFU85_07080 [Planctomycetota bacterium]
MDFKVVAAPLFVLLAAVTCPCPLWAGNAIEFDVPSVVPAIEVSGPGQGREVSLEIALSSLIANASSSVGPASTPPIDHLLIRCRFRQPLHVLDYQPRTELQSDYDGALTFTNKRERTDSFGLNLNGQVQTIGGHLGSDEQLKRSDSAQYQKRPPQQAVVASGKTDRGRGVYFKFRWTADQVLEGEKRFRFTVAVPETWRGGLIDLTVAAKGFERPLFGAPKLKTLVERDFVIATHRQRDVRAAELSVRLARLDRRLSDFASTRRSQSNSILHWWKRSDRTSAEESLATWYRAVTSGKADPYLDEQIKKLPMEIRVAVLDYADLSRELKQLSSRASKEAS